MADRFIDTNIIIRYLVDRDLRFEELLSKGKVRILNEVLFETVFVLQNVYGSSRDKISENLIKLLCMKNVESNKEELIETLVINREIQTLGLVDCFLLVKSGKEDLKIESNDKQLMKLAESLRREI